MRQRETHLARWRHAGAVSPAVAVGMVMVLLAAYPAPLLPLARAYQAVCERYPFLSLLTFHAPAAPVALLLSLAGFGIVAGAGAGLAAFLQTHRINMRLRRSATTMPPRLARLAADLGIADRVTYVAWAHPTACCFGFLRPQIAITASLLTRLDDIEVTAVLAHERQHLRRRDPLRYLALHAVSAGAFMVPLMVALRERQEARMELAADRAALAVAPRGALAGALLAVLNTPRLPAAGVAGLTATEARITHLSGRVILPAIPRRLVVSSLGLAIVFVTTLVYLAVSAHLVDMVCEFCTRVV